VQEGLVFFLGIIIKCFIVTPTAKRHLIGGLHEPVGSGLRCVVVEWEVGIYRVCSKLRTFIMTELKLCIL